MLTIAMWKITLLKGPICRNCCSSYQVWWFFPMHFLILPLLPSLSLAIATITAVTVAITPLLMLPSDPFWFLVQSSYATLKFCYDLDPFLWTSLVLKPLFSVRFLCFFLHILCQLFSSIFPSSTLTHQLEIGLILSSWFCRILELSLRSCLLLFNLKRPDRLYWDT